MTGRDEEMDLMGGCGKEGNPPHCTAHNAVVLAIRVGQETMKRLEEMFGEVSRANVINAQTMAQIGARMEEHISIHKITEVLMKRQEDHEKGLEERDRAVLASAIATAVSSAIQETLHAVVPKVLPRESRWEILGWSLLEKVLWVIAAGILILLVTHGDIPKLLGG